MLEDTIAVADRILKFIFSSTFSLSTAYIGDMTFSSHQCYHVVLVILCALLCAKTLFVCKLIHEQLMSIQDRVTHEQLTSL